MHTFGPRTVLKAAPELRRHAEVLREPRGAGYWLWKPFAIRAVLDRVPEGDWVLYLDAGTEVVAPLAPLLALPHAGDIVLFHHKTGERLKKWTKRDCFVLLGLDRETAHQAPILCAGVQLYRAGSTARRFVSEVAEACTDRRILTDDPNRCGFENLPDFVEHRHDQSVLSLCALKHGIETHPDPSQYGEHSRAPYGQLLNHHREQLRFRPLSGLIRHVRDRW